MHLQRNATQRNAYQNYILLLTNNFKFYILQILGHLNFLSVFFRFAKNQFESLITRRLTLCAFGKPLVLQFREKHQDATARKGFALRPLGKTHCYSGYAFSYALKNKFAILNNNAASAPCVSSAIFMQGVRSAPFRENPLLFRSLSLRALPLLKHTE